MPVKVTAWSCKFKCGKSVQTSKARMVHHEGICFHNLERRACQTCQHNMRDRPEYWDDGPCDECAIDKLPKDRGCTYDCNYHKAKEGEA